MAGQPQMEKIVAQQREHIGQLTVERDMLKRRVKDAEEVRDEQRAANDVLAGELSKSAESINTLKERLEQERSDHKQLRLRYDEVYKVLETMGGTFPPFRRGF